MFSQKAFEEFILSHNIIGTSETPLTLKSGRQSHWYVNWRTITEDVYLMDVVTDFIIAFVKDHKLNPDCFYGVPEGGTKYGLFTQYKWAKKSSNYREGSHVLAMGRAKPKEHGMVKDKYFLGPPQGRVIVLEDTVTTGGSLLSVLDTLQTAKVEVIAVLVLTDRQEKNDAGKTVRAEIEARGISYFALSKATDLLPRVTLPVTIRQRISAEFQAYGAVQVPW